MAAPIIRSSGSVSGVVTGAGRNDLDIGETVTLTDSQVANSGATYQWTLEDKPIGSLISLVNPTSAAPTLSPDVTGSYRIRCTVNGVAADTSVQVIAVPLPVSGSRIPSFNERLEYTGGGNPKGWHETMTHWMRTVDAALAGVGVAADIRASVSATDTTAGFLDAKVLVTSGHLTKTKNNPSGNETLTFGLPSVGPGAGVYGGGGAYVSSVTLDAQGRVTGIATATPAAGANALGTYVVQTSANAPTNAQVLASLATGFAKVANGTGVVSTQASIAGTDLSGFTNTTIPVANSSGQLVSSTITLASNVLTHAASSGGGAVTAVISNTSTVAASSASLTVLVGGTAAGNPSISLGVTGGSTWHHVVDNATNDCYQLLKGSTVHVRIDPTVTYAQWAYTGPTSRGVALNDFAGLNNTRAGSVIFGVGFSTGTHYLNIGPDSAGTPGRGVAGVFWDGSNWQNAISWTHVAGAGAGKLALMENGGNVAIGSATPPTTMNGGVAVANGTAPTADPTGGFAAWAEAGSAKFRGSDSTLTTLATYAGSHTASRSGDVSWGVSNTSANGAATATLEARVGSGTSGNPRWLLTVTGGTSWTGQVNNPTSDQFELLAGSTVTATISTAGTWTFPKTAATAPTAFGDRLTYVSGSAHQVEVGNTSGDSVLMVGQHAEHGLVFKWTKHASNAFFSTATIETAYYQNPIAVAGASLSFQNGVGGNIGFWGGPAAHGARTMFIGAGTAPAGNPTSGFYEWNDASGKWCRGPNGTVTMIAAP